MAPERAPESEQLKPRVSIPIGECAVARSPVILSTLLGSCVAACLYDPAAGVIGMNHFLLPANRLQDSASVGASLPGRYGIFAMEILLNRLFKAGAKKAGLRAKIFGGASLLTQYGPGPASVVGDANVRFIRAFLSEEAIPVVSEDLGGSRGRMIYFHSDTFEIWRRYIKNDQVAAKVSREEETAWRRSIMGIGAEGGVTLF